jgi:hypothetical protein
MYVDVVLSVNSALDVPKRWKKVGIQNSEKRQTRRDEDLPPQFSSTEPFSYFYKFLLVNLSVRCMLIAITMTKRKGLSKSLKAKIKNKEE